MDIRTIYRLYIQGVSLKNLKISSEFISNKENLKFVSIELFNKAQELLEKRTKTVLNFNKGENK